MPRRTSISGRIEGDPRFEAGGASSPMIVPARRGGVKSAKSSETGSSLSSTDE
jgi:hypothetical protein